MKKLVSLVAFCSLLLFSGAAFGHSAICSCFDNGDGTITCEGGFSDGSSASGVAIRVLDASGSVLIEGKMNADSEYTFDKPAAAYKVLFDAGEGHTVEIDGAKILE